MFTRDTSGVYAANNRQVLAALQAIEDTDAGILELEDDEPFNDAELAALEARDEVSR